jgi:hypothetical protein
MRERSRNPLDEVMGIARFMLFLSDRLPSDIYQTLQMLQREYIDQQMMALPQAS